MPTWLDRELPAGVDPRDLLSVTRRAMAIWGDRCHWCRIYLGYPGGLVPTVDHVVALSLGGEDSAANRVPCCERCNGRKRNLTLAEWES